MTLIWIFTHSLHSQNNTLWCGIFEVFKYLDNVKNINTFYLGYSIQKNNNIAYMDIFFIEMQIIGGSQATWLTKTFGQFW